VQPFVNLLHFIEFFNTFIRLYPVSLEYVVLSKLEQLLTGNGDLVHVSIRTTRS